ncbi:MAG: 4-hydroxythreonine-4-phosphate dehydrogenase PdxA [Zoogloea sp.]|jgi:4-hydroxythreonine-4-phosphate dehydrogenase|nr:4-hydroxythreonine-4-phosphate dehydrogenase PdxA [Zoogloea sp.]MBP7392726.1 4-hydroxythreonine-4-phosphate dehydrogenase PdxA [Zoogloea sp.]
MPLPILAITSGEPAGIGPDLCAALPRREWPVRLVVLGDRAMIAARIHAVEPALDIVDYAPDAARRSGALEVLHVPMVTKAVPGRLDAANARYVLDMLDRAIAGCKSGEFAGMVTAPVHKGIICDAGVPFSGHTEYLAEATGTPLVVMMLVGGGLRVALATTHLPLKDVSAAITRPLLTDTLRILHTDLRQRFGLAAPRILVAGLNPHAGEGGHMGTEEIEVITPVLEQLRAEGMQLIGPLPADTLFVPHTLEQGDAVLAMFHDQGLPVLKHASFGGGVNVTLGLPIIRTSVDHGTALDLAGSGRADPGSLFAAVELAIAMAKGQTKT